MTLVLLVGNPVDADVFRQTPGSDGIWGDVRFTLDANIEPDYIVIINCMSDKVLVRCDPERAWVFLMEPPIGDWQWFHRGSEGIKRIYTSDSKLTGARYRHGNPSLPWHVDKSYDELINEQAPEKPRVLSWVTSNKAKYPGHRKRMDFLTRLQSEVDFDLYGHGFQSISDKWDGLAPYKYSIAVENHRNDWYWTEKIADCFLTWTMPIYCGCGKIAKFFPEEAFVQVDIDDPGAIQHVREIISSDRWERNLDAIEHARNLVLNHYQIFPFVCNEISSYESLEGKMGGERTSLDLYELTMPKTTVYSRILNRFTRL